MMCSCSLSAADTISSVYKRMNPPNIFYPTPYPDYMLLMALGGINYCVAICDFLSAKKQCKNQMRRGRRWEMRWSLLTFDIYVTSTEMTNFGRR
jgi:hypothetical protein